jgi:hypothetical protein
MARRPDYQKQEEVLSREQIQDSRRSLSLLSPSSVLDFYRTAHKECTPERKPSPLVMQQLVTAWKVLRRWKWE